MDQLLVHIALFDGGSDVFKAPRNASEMSHGLEHQNCHERECHRSGEAYDMADVDPHISIREISEIGYPSHGTIHRIIHEELGTKKVCAELVPHFLTGAHKNWRE